MLEAYISDIQHFCVHDGPGIRTIVFFQGCMLRCKWCQNPETLCEKPLLMFDRERCTGCGYCYKVCRHKDEQGVIHCINCGECVEECYFMARKMSSVKMNVDDVFLEIMKDKIIYKNSGGGITLSGGEPLLQSEFCIDLLTKVKNERISTAIETAGNIPWSTIAKIIEYVDTFLFDYKLYTEAKHIKWTGTSNEMIKDNLKQLCDEHKNIVIRIPIIPGVNDDNDEFTQMMLNIHDYEHINSIHLLPYHTFGLSKYLQINKEYEMKDIREENSEGINRCVSIAQKFGFRVSVGGTGFLDDKVSEGSERYK